MLVVSHCRHLRCVVMRAQTETTDKPTLMIASGTKTTT
jgi:hypothetical protein